jgi:tetratricopeptide (TPR) repeat protein
MQSKFEFLQINRALQAKIESCLKYFSTLIRKLIGVLKIQPQSSDLWYNLGLLFFFHDDYAMAKDMMEYVLILNPQDSRAQDILGYIALDTKHWESAIVIYSRMARLDPSNERICNNIGISHQTADRFEPAKEAFEVALSHNPLNITVLNNLANLYMIHNQFDQAKKLFSKVTVLNPGNEMAGSGLLVLYADSPSIRFKRNFFLFRFKKI